VNFSVSWGEAYIIFYQTEPIMKRGMGSKESLPFPAILVKYSMKADEKE
jgi:hypothetical protein